MAIKKRKESALSQREARFMPVLEKPLTIENVDLSNPSEMREFWRQVTARGMERVRRETAELQAQGLMDKDGKMREADLPPDMLPGAERDFGG